MRRYHGRMALLVTLVACSDDSGKPGDDRTDAALLDAASKDASSPDAAAQSRDADAHDAALRGADSAVCSQRTLSDGGRWGIFIASQAATDTAPPTVRANTRTEVRLRRLDCCYSYHDEAVCSVWLADPIPGVHVEPTNPGFADLVVGDVAPGTSFEVSASVGDAQRSATFSISSIEQSALLGTFTETARNDCQGKPIANFTPVQELVLSGDGNIQVTWHPFERFVDYWGTFQSDSTTHAFSFTRTGGNTTPADIDGTGSYEIDTEGLLHLRDLYLGTYQGETPATSVCEQVFKGLKYGP